VPKAQLFNEEQLFNKEGQNLIFSINAPVFMSFYAQL